MANIVKTQASLWSRAGGLVLKRIAQGMYAAALVAATAGMGWITTHTPDPIKELAGIAVLILGCLLGVGLEIVGFFASNGSDQDAD